MKSLLVAFVMIGAGGIGLTAALVHRRVAAPASPPSAAMDKPAVQEHFAGSAETLTPAELRAVRIRNAIEMREWHRQEKTRRRPAAPVDDAAFERWRNRVLPTPRNALPKVGTCYSTRIKWIGGRIGELGEFGSGSAVLFENALYQVSYDEVRALVRSRPGDKVKICVVALPKHCPPGDFRGIDYRTINRRTHDQWTMPDSEHRCGGL